MPDDTPVLNRQHIIDTAITYLDFSAPNKALAESIAEEAADMLIEKEKQETGSFTKLPFEHKVRLAARACIRHGYTSYDDRFIEKTIEQSSSFVHEPDVDGEVADTNEVGDFIRLHRR